jgi:hypothetical protein
MLSSSFLSAELPQTVSNSARQFCAFTTARMNILLKIAKRAAYGMLSWLIKNSCRNAYSSLDFVDRWRVVPSRQHWLAPKAERYYYRQHTRAIPPATP